MKETLHEFYTRNNITYDKFADMCGKSKEHICRHRHKYNAEVIDGQIVVSYPYIVANVPAPEGIK